MIALSFDQLNNSTCKKHFEERCKILHNQGDIVHWHVSRDFPQPRHCIVCMSEELESLREANLNINKKRLFLLRALDASYKVIDALPPSESVERILYLSYKERLEADG